MFGSWLSRKFFGGCAVLFPMVVTVYITWWFLTFFDNFFSVSFSLHALHKEVLSPDAWHTHSSHMPLQCTVREFHEADACLCLQPVYEALFGFHVFGLGFITSMGFIIGTGVDPPPQPLYAILLRSVQMGYASKNLTQQEEV